MTATAPRPATEQPTATTSAEPTPTRVLLTVEEAAHQLSLGRTTLYALLKTGAITSVKVGRLRRVPADALADYTARLITEHNAA